MKLLSAVAVAGVTVVLLLTATATVTAACLANPHACAHGIGEEGAVSIPFDPLGGPMTVADLDAISRAIGAQVPTYSVLRDPDAYGTGWGGPSINMLAPTMKMAVARLEIAIGQRLNVVSGYRTAGYQAQLCQRVAGPCAPPGRSMHQLGLAVDVTNWPAALPHLDRVGLCQPLPANDAGHLSQQPPHWPRVLTAAEPASVANRPPWSTGAFRRRRHRNSQRSAGVVFALACICPVYERARSRARDRSCASRSS